MAVDVRTFVWNNLARSVLAELIGTATTEFDVADGSLFPTTDKPGDFTIECDRIIPLIIWNEAEDQMEIVYATSRDGNTFTVERAQEGTEALDFEAGAYVVNAATAGFFEQQVAVTSEATAPVLSGELNSDGVTYDLAWTASSVDADDELLAYDIYRDDGDGYGFALIATVASDVLEYNDITADLGAGITYTYYVQPRACVAGAGTASNQVVTLITMWMYTGNFGDEIAYSIDGGVTFQVSSAGYQGYGFVEARIIYAPTYSSEQNMWMGMSYGGGYHGVFTSVSGLRWRSRGVTNANGTRDSQQFPLYLERQYGYGDPDQARWIIGFESNQFNDIWYSDDSGRTWTRADVGDNTSSNARVNLTGGLAYDPVNDAVVGCGSSSDASYRVWRSVNGGEDFTPIAENFSSTVPDQIIWDPDNEVLLVAAGAHAAYSDDGGATWTVNTSVFGATPIRRLWHDPNRSRIYAFAANEYVYYTEDGGASWTEVTTGSSGSFIAAGYDPTTDRIAIYGGDNTLARASFDGWATQETDYYPGIHDKGTTEGYISLGRSPSPIRQSVMLAIGDCDTTGSRDVAFLRSYDGGENWFRIAPPESAVDWRHLRYIESVGRWIALNADGTNRIYYSDDDGDTWTGVNTFPTHASFNSLDIANDLIFACRHASATNSLYYSDDYGLTWNQVDHSAVYTNFEPHNVLYVPLGGGNYVVVGTAGGSNNGIYSPDLSTWAALTSSGPSGTLHGAAYDSLRGRILVKLEISGSIWEMDTLGGVLSNTGGSGGGAGSTTTPSRMIYDEDLDVMFFGGTILGVMVGAGPDFDDGDSVGTVYEIVPIKFSNGKTRVVTCTSGEIYTGDTIRCENMEGRYPQIVTNPIFYGMDWNRVPVTPAVNAATEWEFDFTGIDGFPNYLVARYSVQAESEYSSGAQQVDRVPEGLLIDNWTASATDPDKITGSLHLDLAVDLTNVGFSVTLFSKSTPAPSATTACAFGLTDYSGDGGIEAPATIALFVDSLQTTGGFDAPDIGYREDSDATTGLTAFTNASGPYTLMGTEGDPDIEHTYSFGISGTTCDVYWDGRLLDSFELTEAEVTALGSPHTVEFGAFAGDNLGTQWGELRKIEFGDATVAD